MKRKKKEFLRITFLLYLLLLSFPPFVSFEKPLTVFAPSYHLSVPPNGIETRRNSKFQTEDNAKKPPIPSEKKSSAQPSWGATIRLWSGNDMKITARDKEKWKRSTRKIEKVLLFFFFWGKKNGQRKTSHGCRHVIYRPPSNEPLSSPNSSMPVALSDGGRDPQATQSIR